MRFLLDQGLPRGAVPLLRSAGHECTHVAEALVHDASDEHILRHARAEQSVVVTLDADFHTLVVLAGAASPSVIRVRIEGLRSHALVVLLLSVVARCEDALKQGSLVTVDEFQVRVRRLPV